MKQIQNVKRALVGSVPFIVLTVLGVRALAQDNYFATEPWRFPSAANTYAVAVGDVNRDGHLDVVFGGPTNVLFLGIDGFFDTTTPAWQTDPEGETRSVALGDVDGDGDLDLVCGTFSGPNHLYINEGGTIATSPLWSSELPSTNYTNAVVLADVDGDGDLDLVCGNGQPLLPQANTVYRNEGTDRVFATTPTWTSGETNDTEAIAVGDVNGDGRLDLACGNMGVEGGKNTLYHGHEDPDSLFTMEPVWLSSEMDWTQAVALGDMDGDGDLDLVCGNGYQPRPNALYINNGGELDTSAVEVGDPRNTTSVVLGDVDGDRDLDVVFGNFSRENQLYVNTAGVLSEAWTSTGDVSETQGLVLADTDGDGDLDQITAGSAQTVYENVTPLFGLGGFTIFNEPPLRADVGDVDGDGYVDAILYFNPSGTADDRFTKLYWNRERGRLVDSGWLDSLRTFAVADFDGNGRVDRLVDLGGGAVRLYPDSAGVFAGAPAWEYSDAGWNRAGGSFGHGDVDGDGRIDLLFGGNLIYEQNPPPWDQQQIFYNVGAPSVVPLQPNGRVSYALECGRPGALGDIDGDGDLDVAFLATKHPLYGQVCNACDLPDELILNKGGRNGFELSPVWSSEGHCAAGSAIRFADVNGDGRMDLVTLSQDGSGGNWVEFYLNDRSGVELPDGTADWGFVISSIDFQTGLRLHDLDGDGDIDLVGALGYWPNDGGGFETTTADDRQDWPGGRNGLAGVLSVADLDRDGDVDLIGQKGRATVAVYGRKQPPFKGDPTDPTGQLPNSPVHLREVTVARPGIDPNTLGVEVVAFDVESDPVYIVADYQFEGEPVWRTADFGGASGPLATSPSGTAHSFDWDISRVPFEGRDVVLRLRAVEIPRGVSQVQYVARYIQRVGRLTPSRPEIGSPGQVVFGTVTVGDTVCTDLVVSNRGNEVLYVNSVDLPSREMTIDYPVPFDVLPRGEATIPLCLAPCPQTSVEGDIVIASTDPLNPEVALALSTDIRPLVFRSELLFNPDTLILGDPVTVIVTPEPDVRFEHGYLFYRAHGSAVFGDSIALEITSSGLGFIATIPGESVTEAGLDYYIRVENDCAVTTDPPGAPEDSVFYRVVEVPVTIATTPIPTGETGFLERRTIRTTVELPDGAIFVDGAIHYREGGRLDYLTSPLVDSEGERVGTIPDSLVGARGVEYWVEVQTLTRTLTDPRIDPAGNPHTIRVTVADLEESVSHPGLERRMVSVPLDFGRDFTGTLEALLSDQSEFGPYRHYTPENPENWRCHWYDPVTSSYAELDNDDPRFFVQLGRSFWLVARGTNRIETSPITGTSTPTDGPFEITLEPGGWNQVGNPFLFTVAWDAIRVDTMTMGEAEGVVVEGPVGWSEQGGLRYDVGVLEPFSGYWVKNLADTAVVLRVPPREFVVTPQPMVTSSDDDASEGWRLGVRASSAGAVDGYNYIGMHTGAVSGRDRYDRSEAPMSPGRAVSLYFPHGEWREHPGPYTVDIRGEVEPVDERTLESVTDRDLWGHVWAFDVAKSFSEETVGDDVILEFEGIEAVPTNTEVYLIDRDLGRAVDIRTDGAYTFVQGTRAVVDDEADARFALVAGNADFVGRDLPRIPQETALHQNYPNPFNPATVIRYDIAEAGEVWLEIYNVRGALVKTLVRTHREPGRYEAVWKGDNQAGTPAASGVYLYRLRSGDRAFTRKLVLLK